MTRKQLEIKRLMDEMVNDSYAVKYSNLDGTVTVYKANYDGLRVFLVITPDDFRMYANEGANKCYYCGRLERLSKRAYPTFEYAVSNIKSSYEGEKARKEYEEERIREIEANRNHPDTIRVEYFDHLIKKYGDNKKAFTRSERSVLFNYIECKNKGFQKLIFDDLDIWNKDDYEDLNCVLEQGDITEFVITETSSALMKYLDNLDKLGWKTTGLERINYQENGWRGQENKQIVGIKLQKAA